MAPESATRGESSPASDVWALGVLLVELVTLGARPYGTLPQPQVLEQVLSGSPPPLPSDATQEMRTLTAKCWLQEPSARPSAYEVEQWLRTHPLALAPALNPAPASPDHLPQEQPSMSTLCTRL